VNFEYLVVVSFDWLPVLGEQSEPQDLIEFSWIVVYNGADSSVRDSENAVLHKSQLWVIPERAQVCLDDYPELNKGVSPSSAFQTFEKFLKKAFIGPSKTFCLLLETEARFTSLRLLAQRHTFSPLQSYWKRAFNLRSELNRAYGVTEKLDLKIWMDRLRIASNHLLTAMDEASAMVQVIQHMAREGYGFTNAEWVKERWERNSARTSLTTAWVGGLTWDLTPENLLSFFEGCNLAPDGLVRCFTKTGRFTGLALLEFNSPMDFSEALLRNGQYLGNYPIAVGPAARGEFERISRKQNHIQIQLWGPSPVAPHTQTAPIAQNTSLVSKSQQQTRWSGALATVYEPTALHFAALSGLLQGSPAFLSPNGTLSGHSASSTAPSNSTGQFASSHPSNSMQVDPFPNSSKTTSGSTKLAPDVQRELKARFPLGTLVHLKGLPYTVSDGQIAEFFSTFPPEPNSLVFTTTEEGRASGEAFVVFPSHDQAAQAVRALGGQYIGSRYIDLLIVV
jgi:RNA recognition motif-containing protein